MSSITEVFGFHVVAPTVKNFSTSDVACYLNIINLCGYLPVLGIWSAYARTRMMRQEMRSDAPLAFRVTAIVRSVIEALGCGILFFIPDLITTIGRMCCMCYESNVMRERNAHFYQKNSN